MLKQFKAVSFLIVVLMFVSCWMPAQAQAMDDTYYNRATYKLGRGVANVVFSPIEICRSIDERVDQYGFGAGIFIGLFHGIGRTVGRIITGAIDVVTFPVAQSPVPKYYMDPEFAFDLAH